MYLLIENKVKEMPSTDAITMLGVSFSRGINGRIGQFGTGYIHGIALLARTETPDYEYLEDGRRKSLLDTTKLCLGTNVCTYYTEPKPLSDSTGFSKTVYGIFMKKQNGATKDLNLATTLGELDWDETYMAIREFISNAIDGAMSYDGTTNSVRIDATIPDAKACRAKDGYIRIYLHINDEIAQYVNDLRKNYLCLNPNYNPEQRIYPNNDGGPAIIYRQGVKVGEFGKNSLFHYNLPDIHLRESRNIDSSEAREQCARALTRANIDQITTYLNALRTNIDEDLWEKELDTYYINPRHNYSLTETQRIQVTHNWSQGIKHSLDGMIVCETDTAKTMVEGKGFKGWKAPSGLGSLLKFLGAKGSDAVLNQHEIDGNILCPPTQNVETTLDTVWEAIEKVGMTMKKPKPKVMGFQQNTVIEGSKKGYFIPGEDTVYVRSDYENDHGVELPYILIHECAHYITGAGDYSPDFQEFAFKLSARLVYQQMNPNTTTKVVAKEEESDSYPLAD